MESKITSVTIRPNAAGAGYFVLITTAVKPEPFAVAGVSTPGFVIFDFTQVLAEAARWTTAMLLGREA